MIMANAGAAAISMRFGSGARARRSSPPAPSGTQCDRQRLPPHRLRPLRRGDHRRRRGGDGRRSASVRRSASPRSRNMTALSTCGLVAPLRRRRDGFVLAEGGAALVLEELEHATARGAHIYAEVLGAASTADAHHITAPAPGGAGARSCMELALDDAGITRRRRRAHQRARHLDPAQRPRRGPGDREGLRRRERPRSPRSRASPATRSARPARSRPSRSALTIERALIPPTVGLEELDPEIHLDVVTGAATPVHPGPGALQQLRLRRPQRLPRARARSGTAERPAGLADADLGRVGASATTRPGSSIPTRSPGAPGSTSSGSATQAEVPDAHPAAALPPWRRIVDGLAGTSAGRSPAGTWSTGARARAAQPGRALAHALRIAFARPRADLHQARPDPLLRRGHLPARARRRVQAAARPGPARAVRRRSAQIVEADLGRPLEEVFSRVRPPSRSPRPRSPRSTGRGCEPARRSSSRCSAPTVATLVRNDLAVMSFLAPLLVGRIPIAVLANPPALIELFAETIVEELDFRLEAENMLDIAADPRRRPTSGRSSCPGPTRRLVTPRVLVMERLDGLLLGRRRRA